MFQKKGQIIVSKEEYETDPDEFMMVALDAGAEDFVEEDDSYEITTDPDVFGEVREALEKEGVPMASAEVTMIPDNYVTLTDPEDIKNLNRTLFPYLHCLQDILHTYLLMSYRNRLYMVELLFLQQVLSCTYEAARTIPALSESDWQAGTLFSFPFWSGCNFPLPHLPQPHNYYIYRRYMDCYLRNKIK